MSIQTIRITVNNAAALDGATELPVGAILANAPVQGAVIEVATDQPFGVFDPGQFTQQQNLNLLVASVTVVSEGAAVLPAGSVVNVVGPDRIGGGVVSRQLADLNATTSGSGLIPKSNLVVPVDHKLGFVGAAAGPHVIQVTLVPVTDAFIQSTAGSSAPVAVACVNTVIVQSEADFPAAVAGVITLVDDTRYHICGTVALTGTNRIVLGNNTPVQGGDRLVDAITGNTFDILGLIHADADQDVTVQNLTVSNPGGAAITSAVSTVRTATILDCTILGDLRRTVGLAGGAHLSFIRNNVAGGGVLDAGLRLSSVWVTAIVQDNVFTSDNGNLAAIILVPNPTWGMVDISDNTFLGDPLTAHVQVVGTVDDVQQITIERNNFSTDVPAFDGFDQSDPGVRVFANTGGSTAIVDTVRQGGISFTGNAGGVETVIAVQGTYVRLGEGNPGTHPLFVLDGESERFSLVGVTADAQVLRYDGNIPFRGILCVYLMGIEIPAITSTGVLAQLVHDPAGAAPAAVVPQSTIEGGANGEGGDSGMLAWAVPILAAPLDEFFIEVANATGTDNLVFSAARLNLHGTAV